MKDWEVLKCDGCSAPMKPSGRSATCEYCGTVYTKSGDVPPLRMEYTADELVALDVAPCMSAAGWVPTFCRDGRIEWSTSNQLVYH